MISVILTSILRVKSVGYTGLIGGFLKTIVKVLGRTQEGLERGRHNHEPHDSRGTTYKLQLASGILCGGHAWIILVLSCKQAKQSRQEQERVWWFGHVPHHIRPFAQPRSIASAMIFVHRELRVKIASSTPFTRCSLYKRG